MENKELNTQDTVMTPDVYKKTFWRTFPLQACFCFERMQNVGFAYMMVPALKKLYTDKKDISDALKRHLAIFNTTPAVVSFIAGASIAMEEKFKKAKDNGEEVDEESINAVKTALMGPLAGIGDSFFWGTFRIIGAGIGKSLAAKGSILGAILFLLIYNIPHFLVRYYGLKMGYKSGVGFLASMNEGGVVAVLTEAAKVLGLLVVGSMCASMVSISTPFVFHLNGTKIVLQEIFDGIIKGFLPLGFTFIIYTLLEKGMKSTTLLWGILILGIVCSFFGIL